MPTDGYFYVQVRKFSTVCELIATHAGTGRLYTNHYGGSKWQGWCNISDSGNAATVGGKSEADFSQNLGSWSSGDIKDLSLAAKSGYAFVNSGVTGVFSSAAVTANASAAPKPLAAGDRVQVVAPYASSAYAKTAATTGFAAASALKKV